MVKAKLTVSKQQVASDILMQFMFTRNMEDVIKVWQEVYEQYELCDDPFTHTPCTPKEYAENCLEYERQTMFERYGHYDGLSVPMRGRMVWYDFSKDQGDYELTTVTHWAEIPEPPMEV